MTCWKIHHPPLAIMYSPCTGLLRAGLGPHWGLHPIRALVTAENLKFSPNFSALVVRGDVRPVSSLKPINCFRVVLRGTRQLLDLNQLHSVS